MALDADPQGTGRLLGEHAPTKDTILAALDVLQQLLLLARGDVPTTSAVAAADPGWWCHQVAPPLARAVLVTALRPVARHFGATCMLCHDVSGCHQDSEERTDSELAQASSERGDRGSKPRASRPIRHGSFTPLYRRLARLSRQRHSLRRRRRARRRARHGFIVGAGPGHLGLRARTFSSISLHLSQSLYLSRCARW